MLGNIFIENDLYLNEENSISFYQQSASTMQSSVIRDNQIIFQTVEAVLAEIWLGFLKVMVSDLQNFNSKMLETERQRQDDNSLRKWNAYSHNHNIKKNIFNQKLLLCQKELQNSLRGQNPLLPKIKQVYRLIQSTQMKISRKINSLIKQKLKSKVNFKKGGKYENPRSLQSVSKSKKKIGQQDQKRKNVSYLSLPKKKNDLGYKNLKIQLSKKKNKNNQDKNSKPKKQQSKKNISVCKPKSKIGFGSNENQEKFNQKSKRTFVTDPNFQFYQNKKKIRQASYRGLVDKHPQQRKTHHSRKCMLHLCRYRFCSSGLLAGRCLDYLCSSDQSTRRKCYHYQIVCILDSKRARQSRKQAKQK